jgi:3-phenylpropionate/cinnamic acid dioxygenase small subunit
MRKWMGMLIGAITTLSLILAISCTPASTNVSSYADDRAAIEDLQARYMFALDWRDLDAYLSTFTEDGILDIVGMKAQGHDEIRKLVGGPQESAPEDAPEGESAGEQKEATEEAGLYPATGRHNITNIVLKIDGDKAVGRAYWFHYGNNNPERKATFGSYGHYEDEMVKVDGQWLFSKRVIYNEQVAEWIGPKENPCW